MFSYTWSLYQVEREGKKKVERDELGKRGHTGGTSCQKRLIGMDMTKGQEVCTCEPHQVVC